jgi:deazaflavin-dependent oxidoreductase (nitroreductase family)
MTADAAPRRSAVPTIVSVLNPLVRRLLGFGMPMGPNVLLTVRGRTSGQPRTFPVTVVESDGHSYVFAAFGDVNWVHNLRAAGEATVRRGRREEPVAAVELTPEEAGPIMQAALSPFLKVKGFGSMLAGWYGVTPESSPADYLASARIHPGFELKAR